jgi:glycosyltransferase involved in cell wall biosynthesis
VRHIVIVSTSYPLNGDGQEAAGTFVADFAHQLAQKVRVTVLAPALQAQTVQVDEQLTVRYFAVPRLPLSLLKASRLADWWAIISTLSQGKTALQTIVSQQQVDFIFALWVLPSGYWARTVAKQFRIPYATWALGSDIWSLKKLPLVGSVLRAVLQESTINFADGYQLCADVKQIAGRDCHFLPSTRQLSLDHTCPLAQNGPYTLVFLGRWHTNKGVDLLLASLALLTDQDWQQIRQVRLAGGGPLAADVAAAVACLQQQGRPVELQGYLAKAAATEFLSQSDYVLIPSRIESIPVIFSDAMKCRSPVIAMPVGDLPELLQHFRVGVLASDVTALAYAKAIQSALGRAPAQFSQGLDHAVQLFSPAHIVDEFLQWLR